MSDLESKLKELEKREQELADERARIESELKAQAEAEKKLEKLVKDSGMEARDLVKALIRKYNLRPRAYSADDTAAPATGRRRRTTMTAELRDEIATKLKKGQSMNSLSKELGISYAVIAKVRDGKYKDL